jgi:gluconate 2-dehydrogenase gamma chain
MLYNRRNFIKTLGLVYGSLLLAPACTPSKTRYHVFTDAEAACLIALCEQIIPADENPGATEAGVINFIDKQTYLRFPEELPVYRQGITSLQATCHAQYGKPFEQLEISVQIEVMQNMEHGNLPEELWTNEAGQSAFFNLVLRRTMQGFYGAPRHGGNKNYVSYQMMKLDYPLLIGQNRYRHG